MLISFKKVKLNQLKSCSFIQAQEDTVTWKGWSFLELLREFMEFCEIVLIMENNEENVFSVIIEIHKLVRNDANF